MSITKNFQKIIAMQREALQELEQEVQRIRKADLTIENEALKREAETLQISLQECQERLRATSHKNVELKNALYDQIYSEKLNFIHQYQKKKEIYFKSAVASEENKLTLLEQEMHRQVDQLSSQMQNYRLEEAATISEKLKDMEEQISQEIAAAKEKMVHEAKIFSESTTAQVEKLKEDQITDEMVADLGKKNNLEALVGGNLANKLGIFFIILGVIAVSRYTMYRMSPELKGFIMFAISGSFLLFGEFLNRKKPSLFSLGITSAGVAGLYVSLSVSYFGLDVLSMYSALLLCILITTGSFVLARRYDSQTIATFALIGGYLPLSSISGHAILIYGAMVYFVILNFMALGFSFYKKWKISMIVGFSLNLIGTIFITQSMISEFYLWGSPSFSIHHVTTMLYVLFSFGVYSFIPLIGNYRTSQRFSKADLILLSLNTATSSLLMYGLFYIFNWEKYTGLLALVFAMIYVGLAWFVQRYFVEERKVLALFYLTGLTFVILVVPFQFGKEWLSLGWLVQGTCLAIYGIYKEEEVFKKSGYLIFALCVGAFFVFDGMTRMTYGDPLFSYKYLSVTAGSLLILASLVKKHPILGKKETFYKYGALMNFWLFLLTMNYRTFYKLGLKWDGFIYNLDFLSNAVAVVISLMVAYGFLQVRLLLDKGVQAISTGIGIVGMLHLLSLVTSEQMINLHRVSADQVPFTIWLILTAVLIILTALTVLTMRTVMIYFSLRKNMPVEWIPLGISGYFLILLTQTLIHQYDLSFTSATLSLIYLIVAIGAIYFGFARRYSLLRRLGLGLTILAVFKLFLLDLHGLTQGYQIISYFSFGIILFGISYLYQYFTKKLIRKEESVTNHEEIGN